MVRLFWIFLRRSYLPCRPNPRCLAGPAARQAPARRLPVRAAPARKLIDATPPRTLAGVLARVQADEDLTALRRRDVGSALRTLGRVLELEPEQAQADPAVLRARLEAVVPARWGMSAKRWANVRSDAMFALRRFGACQPYRPVLSISLRVGAPTLRRVRSTSVWSVACRV